jgi:hypothetical protein
MGAAGAVMGGMGLISGVTGLQASLAKSRFEQKRLEQEAQSVGYAAKASEDRGAQQDEQSRLKYGSLRGEQKSAYGASGMSVSSGSPVDTLANTQAMSAYDSSVIQNNAAREAWGYRSKADDLRKQKGMLARGEKSLVAGSVLRMAGGLLGSAGGLVPGGEE